MIGGIERRGGANRRAAKQADNARPVDRMSADLGTGGIGVRVRSCEAAQGLALALYGRIFLFFFERGVVCSVDTRPD